LKAATSTFAAIAGATVGFIAGSFAAFVVGTHEKTAFFSIALSSALALALGAVAGVSRLRVAFPQRSYGILAAVVAVSVAGLWCVLRMIKAI
jgi:hypothetical protein